MWFTVLQLGVRNLLLHKLRSFLTMLGTILGVGSVIAMLAIGEGSKREAIEQIQKLGAANVILHSVKPEVEEEQEDTTQGTAQQQNMSRSGIQVVEYGLTYNDLDLLQDALPTMRYAVPIAMIRQDAYHGRRHITRARILGTTPEYLEVKNLTLRSGKFLTDIHLHTTANIAVLSAGAARTLFSYEDPIGQSLLIGPAAFRVVGVLDLQDSGNASAGSIGQKDFNQDIYIPITAAQRRIGELQLVAGRNFEHVQLHEITIAVTDDTKVSQTAEMARKLLEKNGRERADVEIQVPLELLRQAEKEKRIWNIVLGSIAGISLLVGGIGIMNIMLATVTERTREIGIRRALGARRRDIVAQFLVETTVISTSGGIVGILVGVSLPLIVTALSDIETALSWWSILLAFGISVAIGIVFGVYPARRAAMMDPIEALRHQ